MLFDKNRRAINRCEASTMELAPRNKESHKTFYKNEFRYIKMTPSDAEFNSASNSDIFTHGKTIGNILSEFFHSIRSKIKI